MITYLFIAVCCVAVWSTIAFFVMRADRNDWRVLATGETNLIASLTRQCNRLHHENNYLRSARIADLATITAYEDMLKTYPINSDDYIPPVNGMGIDESGVQYNDPSLTKEQLNTMFPGDSSIDP